ncbi:MAG: hypothetical protein IPK64_17120 [bacterium]|nr:hypothetical protein [bacterium]
MVSSPHRLALGIACLATLAVALPAVATAADAAPSRADTLAALHHRLDLAADGAAELLVTAVLGAPGPAVLRLPFGYDGASGFSTAVAPVGPTIADDVSPALPRELNGRLLLEVAVDSTAATGDTVRVSCRLAKAADWDRLRSAFGAHDLSRRFVNDTELTIGSYRLVLVLPPEFRIRQVTGSEPAFKPRVSPTPPYALTRVADRDQVTLAAGTLRPGAQASLGLIAERTGRGKVPLVAGLSLAALYLIFFRKQVGRTRPEGAVVPNREDQA